MLCSSDSKTQKHTILPPSRPGEGSLLPLWRFPCLRGTKNVTSLCWSPLYMDLFAVGYGSYHFLKQGGGLVAIWSLKNPTHPELMLTLDSGGWAWEASDEMRVPCWCQW